MKKASYAEIIDRLFELQALIFELHDVQRLVYVPTSHGSNRRENDSEHSFSIALSAWYLCGHFPELDRDKVIRYALAHDLVEVHAGDVMAIGRTPQQQAEKEAKEAKALTQLKTDWPDFTDMTDTIEAYERQEDAEARFVKALDKIIAPMMHIKTDGALWKERNIQRNEVIENKDETTKHDDRVQALWQEIRQHLLEHDELFNTNEDR